jgi:hypothetical protein
MEEEEEEEKKRRRWDGIDEERRELWVGVWWCEC